MNTLDKVKMGMRQSEPQAGDDSKKAVDEKQKDVARRSAELKKKQAEAAGVYKEGYATPLRVDSPAGVDLDADKDPEEQPAGFDLDVEEERDDPADRERLMSLIGKIGSSNQAMELARQRRAGRKRDEEDRRRSRTGPQEGGDGGGGPGGDPPKGPGPEETNTEIYAEYLPEHLEGDALTEAARNAAKKQFDDEFAGKDPITQQTVGIDGEDWDKVTYGGGEVFIISPTGAQVFRGHNVKPTTLYNYPKTFDHISPIDGLYAQEYIKYRRLAE